MRRLMLTLGFAVVVMVSTQAFCQDAAVLSVDVPFAFTVGKSVVPAGHYTVQIDRINSGTGLGSAIILRDGERAFVSRVKARPDTTAPKSGAVLVFTKYSNSYFLSRVESYGLGCQLNRSAAEKEMLSTKQHNGATVSVAAE